MLTEKLLSHLDYPLASALVGGGIGGLSGILLDRKKRWRGGLVGAGLGAAGGFEVARRGWLDNRIRQHAPTAPPTDDSDSYTTRYVEPARSDMQNLLHRLKWGVGGGLAVGVPATAATALYGNLVVNTPARYAEAPKFLRYLQDVAKLKGVPIITGPRAEYNAVSKQIMMPAHNNPAILAHELGHTPQNIKAIVGGYHLANLGSLAGSMPLISSDKDNAKSWATASSLLHAPRLALEISASEKGYNLMRQAGAGRWRALGAGKGLPSYLLMAALPWISYEMKNQSGGYSQ